MYREMFETQKVHRHEKLRNEWSQYYNKCNFQMRQDQVLEGVSLILSLTET